MRHPLARAVASVGMSAVDVAARLGVDPKTVQRWYGGRLPYPRHRVALARLTGWRIGDLWPGAEPAATPDSALAEVRVAYPNRSAVPLEVWRRLFGAAEHEIGVLAYSGLFIAEDAVMPGVLVDRARAGVRVRIALGDLEGSHVAQRGADERIADVMAARIRNALALLAPLTASPGVELRLHDTVLYNSIYWADDDLLVNAHVYGCPASRAPVLHLRRVGDDGMAATYLDSFERVWSVARPVR